MRKTTPAVKAIIEAAIADATLTDEQVETLLREGQAMDIQIVTLLSARKPYAMHLMAVARAAYLLLQLDD